MFGVFWGMVHALLIIGMGRSADMNFSYGTMGPWVATVSVLKVAAALSSQGGGQWNEHDIEIEMENLSADVTYVHAFCSGGHSSRSFKAAFLES